MARPTKKGIDYFPFDVDFLKDIKIRKIKRACGPYTVEVLICLLGNIYRENGYYIGWDEDTSFLVADEVGAKEGLVEEIVKKAVQVNFFNQDKFENYKILTSKGIQERYIEATKKRKEIVIDDIYRVNDTLKDAKTIVNDASNAQSKVKETKVNKSKVNNKKQEKDFVDELSSGYQFIEQPFGSDKLGELIAYYSKNVSPATPVNITDLEYDLNDFNGDLELMKDAVSICARENKRTYNYFSGILKRWRATGVKTHDDYLDSERKWQEEKQSTPKQSYYRQTVRQETMPDWVDNPTLEKKLSPERQRELDQQLADVMGITLEELYRQREEGNNQ